MSDPATQQRPRSGGGREGVTNGSDLFHLVRQAHIFSAVVHEILETKILSEVTSDPLSLSQFHLLKLIALGGEHQVGQVADFLGVSAPAASKSIDKLERLGLVSRRSSPGDRRVTMLAPSSKARRLVKRYEDEKTKRLNPVLDAFDHGEVRQLSALLERFSGALIDEEETGEGLCFRCSAYFDDACPMPHCQENCPYQKVRQST